MNQEQNIEIVFFRQSEQTRCDYRIRLNASIDCVRLLLRQRLAFRGHDESEDSNNQSNFLELLQFLANHNKEIKAVTLKNAPENLKLTSPDVQKDIVQAAAIETIDLIIKDVGDAFFSIRIDESRDLSIKEQMYTVLRYVNKTGHVVERFIGIEHVSSTSALSLKAAIDKLFSRYGLSISRLWGQAIAKKHVQVTSLFNLVSRVVNIVGASSKHCDLLREKQEAVIFEALHNVDVLEMIVDDGSTEQKCEADDLLDSIQSFEFAFNLHLMRTILAISNELSKALQRKDQDIVNAIALVKICKQRLQVMRDNEWDLFLKVVVSFCEKHNIDVPDMDGVFIRRGRSRRNTEEMTNLHHFRVDLFYAIIDMQLQELNDRFSEISTELLLCIACLCLNNSFSAFDKGKLIHFAEYYPEDFSRVELMALDDQFQTYIFDMCSNKEFEELRGLVERIFSAMNIVKNRLRSRIGDQWMNDSLVVYVENDVFNKIDNEVKIEPRSQARVAARKLVG
ncbi:uncharacterized protein LOC127791694 [Diospyros lotus]|uniref:uncharacterized protein LOC127791694 n=1 Tax=Diospyros lotus TaxID=55363 RepID=UPI0022570600|nr:uncharacterized protein LOC127791694 [Diospyros lotus]